MLKHMGERAVACVMQQYGGQYAFFLGGGYHVTFAPELLDGLGSEVHRPQGVLHTRVLRTGVDVGRHAELLDAVQTLEDRMLHYIIKETARYVYKPEYGVVYYLAAVSQTYRSIH